MGIRGRKSREDHAVEEFVAARPQKRGKRNGAAPAHLGDAGRALFTQMCAQYRIEGAADVALLVRASEAVDTITAARASMAKTGPIIRNQYDIEKAHPAVAIEKSARDGFYAALRLLDLDTRESAKRDAPPWVD